MESDSHTPGLEVTAAREKGISHLRLGNLFPSQTESPPCQAQGGGGGQCTAFVPSSLSPRSHPAGTCILAAGGRAWETVGQ